MITQKELKEIVEYNEDTGIFTWKVDKGRAKKGDIAGSPHNNGYKQIRINKKLHLEHRLAWIYVYGKPPKNDIDHINGVRTDNSIKNLRECTRHQNLCNRTVKVKSKSGIKNVCWHKQNQTWMVKIQVKGKHIHIGCFKDIELAELVAIEARIKYHGIYTKDYL